MSPAADSSGRIAILGAVGSPLLGHTLSAFVARGIPVAAVLLDAKGFAAKDLAIWEDRTGGRLSPVALAEFAALQIPFYFLPSHNAPEAAALVRSLGLDVLANGGTPRILKAEILAAPRLGVLNIHPGQLPGYRGCTCVEWAVHNDDEICNTVHFMAEAIDGGPVVLAEGYRFAPTDGYIDVRAKVYRSGFDLLARAANQVAREGIAAAACPPQPAGGNYYSPIPDDLLAAVREKLAAGRYRYQRG